MISRRDFLKVSAVGTAALYVSTRCSVLPREEPAILGGTLAPGSVPKYKTALLIPPVMPKAGTPNGAGGPVDYYEISMRQIEQQILPATLPATTVWGYGAVKSASPAGLLLHNAPSLTIEATANTPVQVKWINELVDENGNYLPHLLPVDPTLHWANPPGGVAGRDTRPTFAEVPGPYTGPVPIVTHVHGAVGVGDESDGYAEAWYLPKAGNLPAGYASEGTWYDYYKAKAAAGFGAAWEAGSATFQYPNLNRASTIWYHDHTLGMTRLNVYAGPAGFYIVRGGPSGDEAVMDSRSGTAGVLPGPAPREGDDPGTAYYEIPIAVQDRSFNEDGSLFYAKSRAFFDEFEGPYLPETNVSPIWNPEFFGNMMMVNGNTWPFLNVEQRRYRFRFLNGCDSRFLILDFGDIPGVEVWQIGNEGGFLTAAVNLSADHDNRLLMALAERADVIVDFTNVRKGSYVLRNAGPDEPFGGGVPGDDFDLSDPDSTGQVLEFRVGAATAPDPSTPPQFLALPPITPLPQESVTRPLAMVEVAETFEGFDGPVEAMLGTVDGSGKAIPMMWSEPISENPSVGDTEVWELYNFTADAHPMHVHEVAFELVDRQPLVMDSEGEEPVQPVQLAGSARPPEPWERGLKDTVTAYPGEVTRIRARFVTPGRFVWHCHIVSHEDNEMMRPYQIGPEDPEAPDQKM